MTEINQRYVVRYARNKHQGRTYPRKDQEWPYFYHVLRVARWFEDGDPLLYAAAMLHDVLEDTDATREEIESLFGARLAELVCTLTRKEGETYRQYIHNIRLDPDATAIKLMDLADNLTHCLAPDAPGYTRSLVNRYVWAIETLIA